VHEHVGYVCVYSCGMCVCMWGVGVCVYLWDACLWWDGGDGALIDDLGDADASNDILADDVLLSDNCENVFNLLSPVAGDPLPPTV